MKHCKYKILCVGPYHRGSNAGGLFRALSRAGHLIRVIDKFEFMKLRARSLLNRVHGILGRKLEVKEFNNAVINNLNIFQPDILLVFKGEFLFPRTLKLAQQKGVLLMNFFPDVSFRAHGKNLIKTLPLYDHIFTTKTFGIIDMKEQLGVTNASFIPHGFDPDVHRYLDLSSFNSGFFECDVSFIGKYSPKKEFFLAYLKEKIPDLGLKIWGGGWHQVKSRNLHSSIMNQSIEGDMYPVGIQSSKINLGLLHERVKGASSGDKITSRTFHIPASYGFMLHERTEEVLQYFEEGQEVACFQNGDELVEKVNYYLNNPEERNKIKEKGYRRTVQENSLDHRAANILNRIKELKCG